MQREGRPGSRPEGHAPGIRSRSSPLLLVLVPAPLLAVLLPVLPLKPSFLSRRLQPALPLQRESSSREVFCTFVVAPCYVMNPGVTPACANADQTPRKGAFPRLRPGQFNPSGFPSETEFPLGKNNKVVIRRDSLLTEHLRQLIASMCILVAAPPRRNHLWLAHLQQGRSPLLARRTTSGAIGW